jgi:organic hydroperoxide reductase OsmC/OhrA
MRVTATITNDGQHHTATVATNDLAQVVPIAAKVSGKGSAVNGGELLFLALATCYGNDLYREAARRNLVVTEIAVTVEGDFGGPGEPASGVTYSARVVADAPEAEILDLMRHTDTVAEIQNTLRSGVAVTLAGTEAVSRPAGDPT